MYDERARTILAQIKKDTTRVSRWSRSFLQLMRLSPEICKYHRNFLVKGGVNMHRCPDCRKPLRFTEVVVLDQLNGLHHASCYNFLLDFKDAAKYGVIYNRYSFFYAEVCSLVIRTI